MGTLELGVLLSVLGFALAGAAIACWVLVGCIAVIGLLGWFDKDPPDLLWVCILMVVATSWGFVFWYLRAYLHGYV